MGQKGHIMVQKGLKMHKKRQTIEFLDLKRMFFSLAELGGTPTPPLTDKIRENVFESFPKCLLRGIITPFCKYLKKITRSLEYRTIYQGEAIPHNL